MAYKFSQAYGLNMKFKSVFGVDFEPFYDSLISVVSKRICIDMTLFDEWIHQVYGNYEDDGLSMEEFIKERFGDKGTNLINELI